MTAVTDRTGATDAPAPSPAEQAEIERFGMFEAEETVERVARALWTAVIGSVNPDLAWKAAGRDGRANYRRLAAAAIAAMPVSRAEAAVRRVEALADKWDADAKRNDDAEPVSSDGLTRMILAARYLRMNAADLRAALATPQTGGGQCPGDGCAGCVGCQSHEEDSDRAMSPESVQP
jgi:hypothetical protein